jgi:serine/threonine protein kinase
MMPQVFQVRKKDTGQVYAMKVLKKKKLVDEGGTLGLFFCQQRGCVGSGAARLAQTCVMIVIVNPHCGTEVEHTRTEKNILINNNHPFLVNLKFAFQTEKKIYFVLGTPRTCESPSRALVVTF